MSIYTFLANNTTGKIVAVTSKSAPCRIAMIKLSTTDCFQTNRVFPGWFGDAGDGEQYLSEWACDVESDDGDRYKITWQFPVVKGEEPAVDELPWGDVSFVHSYDAA